ncbi:MAG: hypothetical protein HY567_00015 [Candidatus Kerfeldbacteria bacterium]|nr:hypothetical protein [Candidatus Kerfeldbacteria bacterium]
MVCALAACSLAVALLLCAGRTFAGTEQTDINRRFKWLALEFQPFTFAGNASFSSATMSNVPALLRTVPVHPDDPQIVIDPLPDPGRVIFPASISEWRVFTWKFWLFQTVGVGAGLHFESEPPWATFADVVSDRYNYAALYPPGWGGAFTYYVVAYESGVRMIQPVIEVRPPFPISIPTPKGKLPFWVFAGYEPMVFEQTITGRNGWDRWSAHEIWHRYEFGRVTYDRVYGGIAFPEMYQYQVSVHVMVMRNFADVRLTDLGAASGLYVNDGPLTVGVGLRLCFF